jgi:dipeptidyl aminopeptidase/acylaminoacyl peptidase
MIRSFVGFFGISLVALAACGSPQPVAPALPPPPSTRSVAAEPQAAPTAPSVAAPRADASLLPRKLLFGNPDHVLPSLSPNGNQIAFIAPDNGVLNIWVGPADDVKSAKVVTQERTRPIRFFKWAFTNEHIVYGNDKGGDENFHIFSVDLKSGKEEDLTPFEGVRAELVDRYDTKPTVILASMNKRDKRFMDPVLIDIKTKAITVLAENTEGYVGYLADRDAKLRIADKMTADGGVELFTPGKPGEWISYAKIAPEDNQTTSPEFFEKNNRTLYFRDSRGRDTSALVTVEMPDGKPKVVFEDPRADVEQLLVHPKLGKVQAVATNRERRVWKVLDKTLQADFDALAKVTEGDMQVVSRSLDDKRWIAAFLHDDAPTGFYLWDRAKKKATFLFTDRAALEGAKLAKMHPVVIKARDGLELVSYISLPRDADAAYTGRPKEPLPMVLFVHGGPWGRDQWGLNPNHQWLANRGYAVLSVNFRASTGFGKKFINAGDHEWAGKMHDDLIDAVKWAIAEKIADPAKVAIMGGSYGGYSTLIGLTFTPDVFACGVDIVGPSNLVTLLNSIPPYWTPMIAEFTHRIGDHRTEEGKKFLFERSALSRVDAIKKPLLIAQGANDPRVKQAESDQIVKAMQAKRLPVTYVLYPDEGHGFARPENRQSFYAVAEVFLAQHLGGKYQPTGEDFQNSTITVPDGVEHVFGLSGALSAKK